MTQSEKDFQFYQGRLICIIKKEEYLRNSLSMTILRVRHGKNRVRKSILSYMNFILISSKYKETLYHKNIPIRYRKQQKKKKELSCSLSSSLRD